MIFLLYIQPFILSQILMLSMIIGLLGLRKSGPVGVDIILLLANCKYRR